MEVILSALKSTQTINVSENVKAVFKAIKHLKESSSDQEVKSFLETVNFESSFEKLVAIKLIDSFKLKENLMNAFSTEDLFVISQSLKCSWFFEDEGNLLFDKNLVLIFFSTLSYSGRCKVIRKYSQKLKDSTKAENLFLILEEIYGIKTALELLPACSEPFIMDIIYSKNIILSSYVVKHLYKKYIDFTIDFIFSYYEKREKNRRQFNETYDDTLIKIASEKTSLFVEFWNKHGSSVCLEKFGRSLTRKILKVGFSSVLRHVDAYLKILKLKNVASSLSLAQIEELHFYLMPKTFNTFLNAYSCFRKGSCLEILDYLKHPFAEELLLKNFKKKYGKSPLDLTLSDDNILICFPEEIRTLWVEKQLSKQDLEDSKKASFSAYLAFDKAFDLLKSLIPTALEVGARINIVENMMRSAKINNDVFGASKVVSYVVDRHRNDSTQVKGKVLEELRENFDLVKLSVEQWKPIIELFNIMIINNDIDSYSRELVEVYEKWIHRRLIDDLSIDAEMELLMKHLGYYYNFSIAPGTKYEAYCLNWFNENLEKKDFANDREKENLAIRLFISINDFTVKHKESTIHHKAWVMEITKQRLGESYSRDELMKSLKKNSLLKWKLFDEIFPESVFPEILLYKLSHNVNDIANNVPEIVCKIMNSSDIYRYKIFFQKLLVYIDLPNKFIEQCLNEIKSQDEEISVRNKENCICILSFLGNANVFLTFVKDFYPTSPKAESESSEAREKYRFQTAICSSLKNVNPPFRALEAVKKFAMGDYLKLVLGSILSVSLKISQAKAFEFLHQNMDTPVSYRKHIIRVFRLVSSKRDVSSLLLTSISNEKNFSIRILLLNSIFDLMKHDKGELSWETVKQCFLILTEADLKNIDKRVFSCQEIPDEYLAEYIEIVWATILRLNMSEDSKTKIYSLINQTSMPLISDEFADLLFSLTYKGKWETHAAKWNLYISLYLNYSKTGALEKRLNNFSQFIKNKFAGSINEKLDSLAELSYLIETISLESLSSELADSPVPSEVLHYLHTNLLQIIPEHEIIKINLKLSLCKLLLKNKSKDVVTFADDICSLIDALCSSYGSHLINIFSSVVNSFVSANFYSNDKNSILIFSHRMITGPTSPLNKILGVLSLPNVSNLQTDTELKMFKSAIATIQSSPDCSLKIFARDSIYNI